MRYALYLSKWRGNIAFRSLQRAVELDAAPVVLLQEKLREAIESVLDMHEFKAQIKLEEQDAIELKAHRTVVLETLKD